MDFTLLEKLNQLELEKRVDSDVPSVIKTLRDTIKSTANLKLDNYSEKYLEKIVEWCPTRVSKIKDLTSSDFDYLWSQPSSKLLTQLSMSFEVLHDLIDLCQNKLDPEMYNDPKTISRALEEFYKYNDIKQKALMKDLRIILCGITVT